MADLRDLIYHRRSPILSKRPELLDIGDGELAINYNANEPGLYFKDLADDGTRKIRKIGPIHVGPTPPNDDAASQGFPVELSDWECWIDTNRGEGEYLLKTWNPDSSQWIEVSKIYARIDENLDQFLDGEDEDNFIHTDGIRLKINNKTALAGFSTVNGNKLVINENNEFANAVELNGTSFLLGGYKFGWDGDDKSNIETYISTSNIPSSEYLPQDIERFSINYRSAKYIIQVTGVSSDGTSSPVHQVCEMLIIHDGIDAFIVEYGRVSTYNDEQLGLFDAYINNSTFEVVLTFQKFSLVPGSVEIKSIRTSIIV